MHTREDLRAVRPPRARRLAAGLAAAVLGTAAVATLYALAVRDAAGRAADDGLMRAAMRAGAGLRTELLGLLGVVSVVTVAAALVVLAGLAVARGRPGRAVSIVAVVLAAQAVTQLLKAGLPRSGDGAENSLPSGHVTLVASLVVAAAIALPAVARPLVGLLGAAVVAGAGVATMVVGWHRPSDVAAAVAVVVAVTGAVAAVSALLPGGPADVPGGPADVNERPVRTDRSNERAVRAEPGRPARVVGPRAPAYRPTVPDLRR